MQVFRREGVALNYRVDHGPAGAPVVVFANSLGTDFRIWEGVVAQLAGVLTLICYDKRGHGLSDAPPGPYALTDHVADLAALFDYLGVGSAIVCGLSVGGLIAQGLYHAHPEKLRGLILCDTGDRIGTAELWDERIRQTRTIGLEAMAEAIMARWFTKDYRDNNPALAAWRNMLARTSAEGYAGTCAAVRDTDLTEKTAGIDVPVLCLAGAEDIVTPSVFVAGLAARIPGARFETIAGAGHIPCVEKPEQMAQKIQSFVTGLDAGFGS